MKCKRNSVSIAAFALALFLGSSDEVRADDATSMQRLNLMASAARSQGLSCRTQAAGRYLSRGGSYSYRTTFYGGTTYAVMAAGDYGVTDIDMRIYDESGNLVASDNGADALPIVAVRPRWTGTFTVTVKMYSGSGNSNFAVCYG